jgi:glyoxylase-like metal-dependent hydrolase (beta-lactamase superfamily II)
LSYEKVTEGVFRVGGGDLSSPEDCLVYLVNLGKPILIDAGAGKDPWKLAENLGELGVGPDDLSLVVLTHCHVDHVGGARFFSERFGIPLAAHRLDAEPLEEGDTLRTAANWYGMEMKPLRISIQLTGSEGTLDAGSTRLHWIHTPGHTPGSISLWLDNGLFRVLFGQDIHGPFHASFGSDLDQWAESMRRLLELNADILCEGHFGVFRPASEVRRYITGYLQDYGKA